MSSERVQLFATCLGDLILPEAVADADLLLREAGFDGRVPAAAGVLWPARLQRRTPQGRAPGSADVRARVLARGAGRSSPRAPARPWSPAISRSCSASSPTTSGSSLQFLADKGVALPRRNEGRTVAYHDSCHMLRELHIHDQPRRLLEQTGASVSMLPRPDLCCGFGGTFSVRQPEVSVAMADDKLKGVGLVGADVLVTADPGCLMHLRGRAARTGGPRVVHLATALARGIDA